LNKEGIMNKFFIATVVSILTAFTLIAASAKADSRDILEKQIQESFNPKTATVIVADWAKGLGNIPLIDAAKTMKEFAEELLEMSDEEIKETIGEAIEKDVQASSMVKQVGMRRLVKFWWEMADYYEKLDPQTRMAAQSGSGAQGQKKRRRPDPLAKAVGGAILALIFISGRAIYRRINPSAEKPEQPDEGITSNITTKGGNDKAGNICSQCGEVMPLGSFFCPKCRT